MPTSDAEIRAALHQKQFRELHGRPDTLIVDELGLVHAKVRVDVAIINGCVHGFEIKSASDTLYRLPKQLALYQECLEKLTVVCAEKHLSAITKILPTWCGLLKADKDSDGTIDFITLIEPTTNPFVRPEKLAHLLWRSEVVALLSRFDASPKLLRSPRKQLYELLAATLSLQEITASIKEAMDARQAWRRRPAPALCGG